MPVEDVPDEEVLVAGPGADGLWGRVRPGAAAVAAVPVTMVPVVPAIVVLLVVGVVELPGGLGSIDGLPVE
ncbi:MAG TPA: hypothetical protein VKE74_22895, partial [Gemmataceae bacterium]|nr:hypothetical protein [Gemmataceae bacterium]